MANKKLSNTDKFKKLTFSNKNKLVDALEELTGRKKITIKQHWLWNDAAPDEYKEVVTKGLDKMYKEQLKQIKENSKKIEKLLN